MIMTDEDIINQYAGTMFRKVSHYFITESQTVLEASFVLQLFLLGVNFFQT